MRHGHSSNPGNPRPSSDQVLARRVGRYRCRDCGQYCQSSQAIAESRGRKRCPACGGILDRELTHGQGR